MSDDYTCVRKLIDDAATALPSCQLIDFMVTHGLCSSLRCVERDIRRLDLDVEKLLSVRPTTNYTGEVRIGILVDTEHSASGRSRVRDRSFDYWENVPPLVFGAREGGTGFVGPPEEWEGDEPARWYATLSNEKHPRTFLGLDWTFVGRRPTVDLW